MRAVLKLAGAVAAAAALVCVGAAPAQGALDCGDTVINDRKLTKDLSCPASTTALTVAANGVEIDLNGHTIEGSGSGAYGVLIDAENGARVIDGTIKGFEYGIRAVDATRITLRGLDIRNGAVGVGANDVNDVTIEDNVMRNSTGPHITVYAGAFDVDIIDNRLIEGGIEVSEGKGWVIRDNTIDDTNGIGIGARAGIAATNGENIRITGNEVEKANAESIYLAAATDGRVARNLVSRGERTGVFMGFDSSLDLLENEVRRSASDGVFLDGSATVVMRENKVTRSGDDGIVNQSTLTTVKHNVANNNGDYGVDSTVNPKVKNNSASGNGNPAQCTPASACN